MPTKRSSSRSSRSARKAGKHWSSSVIGNHATPQHSSRKPHLRNKATGSATRRQARSSASSTRRRNTSFSKQTAEINQMQVETRSVDQRTTQHRASRSRAEEFMKRRPSQQYHHCTRSYLRGRVPYLQYRFLCFQVVRLRHHGTQ